MVRERFILMPTMSLWDEPARGRHHFARLLTEKHRVLWVNRPLSWRERGRPRVGLEQVSERLMVLHTGRCTMPDRVDRRLNLNNRRRLHHVRRVLTRLGEPDVVWTYDYRAEPFRAAFGDRTATLYFCNDYFGEDAFARYEVPLARRVDHVFGTAPKLVERFRSEGVPGTKLTFLPHGSWPPVASPRFAKKGRAVTAGYVGTLRDSLDVDFLGRIVEETDLVLLLGGPVIECSEATRRKFEALFQHEHVRYFGTLDRAGAEALIQESDVCLLPYTVDVKSEHRFAIKYFEYLTMGKPMLATPYFEWPDEFGAFVSVFDGSTGLADFATEVYGHWNEARFDAAIAFARENTWRRRVERIGTAMGLPL